MDAKNAANTELGMSKNTVTASLGAFGGQHHRVAELEELEAHMNVKAQVS